jgi:hypothetical protein
MREPSIRRGKRGRNSLNGTKELRPLCCRPFVVDTVSTPSASRPMTCWNGKSRTCSGGRWVVRPARHVPLSRRGLGRVSRPPDVNAGRGGSGNRSHCKTLRKKMLKCPVTQKAAHAFGCNGDASPKSRGECSQGPPARSTPVCTERSGGRLGGGRRGSPARSLRARGETPSNLKEIPDLFAVTSWVYDCFSGSPRLAT